MKVTISDVARLAGVSTATVAALPQRDDVDLTLQENMIVEFYSR